MSTSSAPSSFIAAIPMRQRHQARTPESSVASDDAHIPAATAIVDDESPVEREKREWARIQGSLPAQITGPYIRVISIGGVIGTGLFLGTAQSLRDGGPLGMFLGYSLTATIVWAVVVSLAEMVAYQPNIGGPVGLADVYVDRALGFAMGWNAWYDWTITLPAELSAAAVIASFYLGPDASDAAIRKCNYITTSVMLFLAIFVNVIGRYGQFETVFATTKICLIIFLIIIGIVIDVVPINTEALSAPVQPEGSEEFAECISRVFNSSAIKMRLGVKYLWCPGMFVQYRNIPGVKGRILSVWSVMMQAIFSYSGSEVPGIAGAEVENPGINIPRAARNIWIRIFLFYILAVFIAGLLVPYTHVNIFNPDSTNGQTYVLSSPFIIAMKTAGIRVLPNIVTAFFLLSAWSAATSDVYISSRYFFFLASRGHAPNFLNTLVSFKDMIYTPYSAVRRRYAPKQDHHDEDKRFVVPIYGVIIAALSGVLAYLPIMSYSAGQAFFWLSALSSAATMLSWICMMITYLRWHAGIQHAQMVEIDFNQKHAGLIDNLKKYRAWGQPFLAWYAIVMCVLIILLHGWAVFDITGVTRIAYMPGDLPTQFDRLAGGTFALVFVTSYLPVPVFFLCMFGYKLIKQTNFVELQEMDFSQTDVPAPISELQPTTFIGKIANYLV